MFVEWNKSAELNRRPAASLLTKLAFDQEKTDVCRILVIDLEYVVRRLKEFPQVIANMMLLSTLLGTGSVSFQEDINGCLEFARQKLKMKPEKDLPPKVVYLYKLELRTTQVPKVEEPGAVASSSADVTVDEAGAGVKANAEG